MIGLGRSDPSAGEYIAEIQRRLAAQDRVRFQLHAMGTELEGATDDILAVVADLHGVPSSWACRASTPSSTSMSAATGSRRRGQGALGRGAARALTARERPGPCRERPGLPPMRRALGRSAPGPAANVPGCPL
ncbi:MAG TPA: thiamine-binding protein [Solirubrobacterales bacterium]|nr:thiamine-binding protein [Solirubrobacterales bacterium]